MTNRSIRFDIERAVDFRLTDDRTKTPRQGRTVNISSSGVLFQTDNPPDVGRRVELIVRMTNESPDLVDIDLHLIGIVVRTGPGWAAARTRKHQLQPMNSPGTPAGTGSATGTPGGQ
jgi:hypothetical protein